MTATSNGNSSSGGRRGATTKKEGWEWDAGLAVLCREEAEVELRRALLGPGDKSSSSKKGATSRERAAKGGGSFVDVEKAEATGGTVAGSTSNDDIEQQQQPHNQADTISHPLPHYLRPRKKQKDYRVSPLESEYDAMLIPDTRVEAIAKAVPSGLERERLFDDHTFRLARKQIWKYNEGCCGFGSSYDPHAPYRWEGKLAVTPNAWADDIDTEKGGGGGKEDNENNPNHPWPLGCEYESGVFKLCWSFYLFVYRKNRMVSWKIGFYQVLCALVPPACSYLYGTGLIDEVSGSGSAHGQSDDVRLRNAVLYVLGIFVLKVFASWLNVHYSNLIPSGGTRLGLRDVLYRRMHNLSNQNLCNKIFSPGACSGLIVDDVHNIVGIYSSFLTIPSHIFGILGNIVVSTLSLPFDNPEFYLPTIVVVLILLTVPIWINRWYQPEACILARLNYQWRLRLRAMSGTAIPSKGSSHLPLAHDDDNATGDDQDDNGNGKDNNGKEKAVDLSQIFHETAFVEKQRHWQGWKMTVVTGFLNDVLGLIGLAIVTICAAYVSIRNKKMSVGDFSTLVTCVSNIITIGGKMGSFYTNLFGKHAMLKQITAIMNDKDIDFDGGVDVIEKYENTFNEYTKAVISRVPGSRAHKRSESPGKDGPSAGNNEMVPRVT